MTVETPGYAAMLERMCRAYGRRVADGDPVDLSRMREVQAALEAAIADAVVGQIGAGFSWREVGEGLGVTKEAAWQRYRAAVAEHANVAVASNTA